VEDRENSIYVGGKMGRRKQGEEVAKYISGDGVEFG